jgi:hypothetical protein
MRRIGLAVAGAVLLAFAAVAVVARDSARTATTTTAPTTTTRTSLTVTPANEQQLSSSPSLGEPRGQVLTYAGDLRSGTVNMGSFRATCVWLGEENISGQTVRRVDCTVLLRLGNSTWPGGTLMAQGQLDRPPGSDLLGGFSKPQLAITGGTGQFRAAGGWIDVNATELVIEVVQSW